MRRHKWEKISKQYIMEEGNVVKHVTRSTKKCVKCGLMKGTIGTLEYLSILVYFKKNKILSKGKLPFKCPELNPRDIFLDKKDFEV